MAYLTQTALSKMGFSNIGKNVFISDRASIYGSQNISIGDNVRIDDFAILSAGAGGIHVGSYIHVAAYSSLIGAGRIRISDFCNLSSKVSIYSSSDDYSGATMTNPMIPDIYKADVSEDVILHRHVIVGCGSVLLPGAMLEEGVAIGALSLVTGDCGAFGIYAGRPAKRIKERSRNLLNIEQDFKSGNGINKRTILE